MTIRMIWAEAHDRVIGANGALPWSLPEDMRLFRQRTSGATVVMGRTTWESLPERFRPLPGRHNVVLTRTPGWTGEGAEIAGSVAEVLERHDDFWVIGGAAVYAAFVPYAGHVVRTEIDLSVDGDTRAPELGPGWRPLSGPGEWQTSTSGVKFRVGEYVR
jgi:dihydrofolate reductase